MAGRERGLHRVERVSEGGGDRVAMQVLGAGLDIVVVGLQPLVVSLGDAVTENVDRLGLALEPHRQLFGDEGAVEMGDFLRTGNRVVVGDGHEVHPLALGQFIHLFGRR